MNTAIQNLKPVDGGSGDGNGEGNGNGSTAETETAVEAQAEAETVVETQAEMEVQEAAAQEIRQCRQATAQTCFVYAGTLLLAAAAFVFGFRRRNQENNSDAEGIRTV